MATDATLQHAGQRGLDLVLRVGDRQELVHVPFDALLDKTTAFRGAVMALIVRAGGVALDEDEGEDDEAHSAAP